MSLNHGTNYRSGSIPSLSSSILHRDWPSLRDNDRHDVSWRQRSRSWRAASHHFSHVATAVFFQRNFCFCQRSSQRIQQHLRCWRLCPCRFRRHTCLLFCSFWVVRRSKTPHTAFLFRTLLCQRGDWLPPFLAIPHHTMWRQRRQRRSAAAAAARVSPSLRSGVFVRFLVGFGCTKLQLVSSSDYYRLPKGLCRFWIINVVAYVV